MVAVGAGHAESEGMKSTVIAATLLLSAATAAAQPALTAPQPYAPPPIAEVKSGSTATWLALGTTIGGVALMGAGADRENGGAVLVGAAAMLIGPSLGHFYAGETAHGVKMSLLRTGAAVVLGAGLIASLNTAACLTAADPNGNGGSCGTSEDDRATGRRMAWLGGTVLVAATLYDLWDARDAAHRANVREARRTTLVPAVMTGASGARVPALVLGGQF